MSKVLCHAGCVMKNRISNNEEQNEEQQFMELKLAHRDLEAGALIATWSAERKLALAARLRKAVARLDPSAGNQNGNPHENN